MSYNADDDVTRYETGRMTVVQGASGGNFASQSSIAMRVMSECSGRECVPEEAQMVFTLQGSSDIAISSRRLTIVTDERTFEWGEEASWNRRNDIGESQGRLMGVTLPLSDLATIAQSSTIDGSFGDKPLNLGGVQSQLRDFLQTAQNPGASASTESS
jgi:hypothetical protein